MSSARLLRQEDLYHGGIAYSSPLGDDAEA